MKHILYCILIATLLLTACSNNQINLTGTSEQGNARITAYIYTSDNSAAEGATVRLRPSDYTASPVTTIRQAQNGILDGVVGSNGKLTLESPALEDGCYFLEVNDNKKEALLKSVTISSEDQIVELGSDTLKPYGTLQGRIKPTTTNHTITLNIPGLERATTVDSTGYFSFVDLPADTFSLQIKSDDTLSVPLTMNNIATASGSITILPERSWYYSRSIYINTSQFRTVLTQPLYNFALPVRLSSDNFDFSKSNSKGKDLWFMKPDRTLLPFQIEQWDSIGALATVWIKIDTINNDDATQYFIMHWGDPHSNIKQTPGNVFEIGNGFQAVWHCNETITEESVDNTFNRYDGTRVFVTATDGVLGNGQFFDGTSSYIAIKNTASTNLNLSEHSEFAIAAWVKAADITGETTIVGKGSSQFALAIENSKWIFYEQTSNPATRKSVQANATADLWTYLCIVRRNDKLYLYINGLVADSTVEVIPNSLLRDETFDVNIGRVSAPSTGSTGFFYGTLDEISISVFPRSDEWIWLSYESQRLGSTLLK